jgi:TonB-dependent starch-binding outer membrane protein SusC
MFIQGVKGNEIYNGTKVLTQGMLRLFNSEKEVLNAWTPGSGSDFPRAISGDPNHNTRTSNRFVEDGSYMRIKDLTLSYTLPQKTMSSLFKGVVSNLSIYGTAQNLLTLTKYSGYDPEIGASSDYSGTNATLLQGVDFGFYPQPRTFIIGVNMSF